MDDEPELTWGSRAFAAWAKVHWKAANRDLVEGRVKAIHPEALIAYALHVALAFTLQYPDLAHGLDAATRQGFRLGYTADTDQDLEWIADLIRHAEADYK